MEQPKPQPTRPACSLTRRIKASRYSKLLRSTLPPVKGQAYFDFSFAEKQEGTEDDR